MDRQTILKLDVFTGEKEKSFFKNISAGSKTDFFQFLLLSGSSGNAANVNSPAEKYASFLQSKGVQQNKEYSSKEIKKLYKEIHDAFLSQYVDNPVFSQIFTNGNYNCATASALYALLLDTLGISYNIRETPQHVYIVAAPATYNIVFETTTPGAMVLQLNEKMKNQYLEYLYNNKLIPKEEWNTLDKNALFEKYFYNDKAINMEQLCGLLYYNLGVAASQNEDFVEAYKNFEKSYFLYPGPRMKYFISLSLGGIVYSDKLKDDDKLAYYSRYMQVGNSELGRDLLGSYMEKASKQYLFHNPDLPRYLTVYKSVSSIATDSVLKHDLLHDHYMDMGHYYSIKNVFDTCKIYLDSLYALNSSDLLVQELITSTITEIISKRPEGKQSIDELKKYFELYPFLKKNSRLQDYYIYCLAKAAGMKYDAENAKEGIKFIEQLKEALEGKPDLAARSEQIVVMAIGEACGYYVRQQNYKTAREMLVFIKKLLPDNEEVNRRLIHVEKVLNKK